VTSRSTRFWLPPLVVALGTACFFVGFIYDLNTTGLPYQPDSPIELQLGWERGRAVADRIYLLSAALVALGLGWLVLRLAIRFFRKPVRKRGIESEGQPARPVP
jgi:hypothetical protein